MLLPIKGLILYMKDAQYKENHFLICREMIANLQEGSKQLPKLDLMGKNFIIFRDQLIYNYLTKNETGSNEEINKSKGRIIVYFIFLAIGLALMIILTPIFIFCLCKPEKCPPCTKFRQ